MALTSTSHRKSSLSPFSTWLVVLALAGCARTEPVARRQPSVVRARAHLPSPRHEPAVFNDGTFAYVLGGEVSSQRMTAEIVRYDPVEDHVAVLTTTLPTGRGAAVAAWTGTDAYVFGGRQDGHVLTDEILRFTPSTGALRKMTARLPTPRYNVAAVWTGKVVLLFGGFDSQYPTDILRYDPASDTLTKCAAKLPSGREAAAAVWDGEAVWLIGGYTGQLTLDTFVRYDPATDTVTEPKLRWPHDLWAASALWDGTTLWVLGGGDVSQRYLASVGAFTPAQAKVERRPETLPAAHIGQAGTWLKGSGYVFGGTVGSGFEPTTVGDILRFVPGSGF